MNLCFECSEYPPGLHGGIGSLIQILARGFVEMGHEVRVIGTYNASHLAAEYEEDRGVKVWRLRRPNQPMGWIAARKRLFSMVRGWCGSGQVDLIEVPDWGAPAAGWPELPVPVVARLSGSASFFSREMGRKLPLREYVLERASLRRASFISSTSRYIAEKTRSIFGLPGAIEDILYAPVEVPHTPNGIERDRNCVMFAGTLTEKKGVISLLKSWPSVAKARPEARLEIWGKDGKTPIGGSMRQYLESLIPPELQPSVQFHGHVALKELLAAFSRAAMAVLPSYAGGFALTPLHAMAHGCPTIYTTRGSGPELMTDHTSGMLVDPDRPDKIARAIVRLLEDRELAARMGANGRQLVQQRFSWPVLSRANERFYYGCLEQFRRRKKQSKGDSSVLSRPLQSDNVWTP